MKSKELKIGGMTCINCEISIENKLKSTKGIAYAKVSYSRGFAKITYDEAQISLKEIEALIEKMDYKVIKSVQSKDNKRMDGKKADNLRKTGIMQGAGFVIILFAAYLTLNNMGILNLFNFFPQAGSDTSYFMLFVIGLMTSIHCVAMCGGINISQCINKSDSLDTDYKKHTLMPSFLYNAGRVISYTIIGGIVGGLGSVISFSGPTKGIVQIIAGIFMVIMGLNLLNIFPGLRKFNLHMPKIFASKINAEKVKNKSPLYIGLLNGLMPCGPLQAMQIYALSTGSPIKGALSMLLFSLGTVPLMFGLGAISSILNKKFMSKMMTVSAALVIVLGGIMLSNGMALSGFDVPVLASGKGETAQVNGNVQKITTELSGNGYPQITVKKGIPVKWNIKATQASLNGCNQKLQIPKYNIEKQLVVGDNIIEFTPDEAGSIPYSCWMGMIRSQINVVDDLSAPIAKDSTGDAGQINNSDQSSLNGSNSDVSAVSLDSVPKATVKGNAQTINTTMPNGQYQPIIVQVGKPVTWTINTQGFESCNTGIYNQDFSIAKELNVGQNIITFTPTKTGTFIYSCSMGMYTSTITVVNDINHITPTEKAEYNSSAASGTGSGGGCCGG